MLEGLGLFLVFLLFLWLCSGENQQQPQYSIEETQYSGFYKVRNTQTEKTEYVGTIEQCEKWIEDNEG